MNLQKENKFLTEEYFDGILYHGLVCIQTEANASLLHFCLGLHLKVLKMWPFWSALLNCKKYLKGYSVPLYFLEALALLSKPYFFYLSTSALLPSVTINTDRNLCGELL